MGVLNLTQPTINTSKTAPALLSLLAQFAHPYIEGKLKEEEDKQAASGLDELFNPPRLKETQTPAEVETSQATQKMGAQQAGLDATKPSPLTDLLAQSQVPAQTVAPELGKMLTPEVAPLQSKVTDVMPTAKEEMLKPTPGEADYRPVPKGLSRADYGAMAKAEMTPSLSRDLALKVRTGELTAEQAYAVQKQTAPKTRTVRTEDGGYTNIDASKLGDTGVKGYTPAKAPKTPTDYFVLGQKEQNPNISAKDLSDLVDEHQRNVSRPAMTPIGQTGWYFDRWNGVYLDETGQQRTSDEVRQRGIDTRQFMTEAQQRGGAVAANFNAANDLYQKNLPLVLALRRKVEANGLLPDSKFKSINEIKQWALQETSDPDLNELKGKVTLMADNLQKTIGGTQGGEWSYNVAKTLLDPSLAGDAFERRMQSHGEDLSSLAESRRGFGLSGVSSKEAGVRPGATPVPLSRRPAVPNRAPAAQPVAATAPAAPASAPTGTANVNLFDMPIERKRR